MKYLLTLSLLLAIIYLNRTYSYFYYKIGQTNLQPTLAHQIYQINNQTGESLDYLALGDSLTSGVGSSDYTQTYPYVFGQNLSQEQKKSVKLLVLSVPGAKTEDLINNQLNDPRLQTANYVTLLVGINDIHELKSVQTFSQNFETIIFSLTKLKAKIIVLNLPYLGPKQSLLFPYQFLFDYQTRQYNKVISQITQKYNLKLIDLYGSTKVYSEASDFYSPDDFHPSDSGYKLWGQLLNSSNTK